MEKVEIILRDSNAYDSLDMNEDKKVLSKITKFVANHQKELTNEEIHCLKFEWKTGIFYGVPKIHKSKQINELYKKANEYGASNKSGRPKISSNCCRPCQSHPQTQPLYRPDKEK